MTSFGFIGAVRNSKSSQNEISCPRAVAHTLIYDLLLSKRVEQNASKPKTPLFSNTFMAVAECSMKKRLQIHNKITYCEPD